MSEEWLSVVASLFPKRRSWVRGKWLTPGQTHRRSLIGYVFLAIVIFSNQIKDTILFRYNGQVRHTWNKTWLKPDLRTRYTLVYTTLLTLRFHQMVECFPLLEPLCRRYLHENCCFCFFLLQNFHICHQPARNSFIIHNRFTFSFFFSSLALFYTFSLYFYPFFCFFLKMMVLQLHPRIRAVLPLSIPSSIPLQFSFYYSSYSSSSNTMKLWDTWQSCDTDPNGVLTVLGRCRRGSRHSSPLHISFAFFLILSSGSDVLVWIC